MDIVVKSRHHEVTDRFRRHVMEKLAKVEEMDGKAISLTVVLGEEKNPRQAEQKDRIELTLDCPRAPVIRAEACAADPYSALDLAAAKLQTQLRKVKDRRKIHRNRKAIAESIKHLPPMADLPPGTEPLLSADGAAGDDPEVDLAPYGGSGPSTDGPMVVREKTHTAAPMTLDQALYEMELVGHDFYLYVDKDSGLPAVVYRRRAYDYGVIRLEPGEEMAEPMINGSSPSDRMAGARH
ncbi:ribosome hibernation-promoting factor, HPF/YfiA family [Catenulispora pinisilvae]|uniref:ribosome hibernation-promoting factor, HPF/YfiA family n=1 Tax=Catenulispora pinisilvae TaxID=2705253 RepID=UPI001892098B|nr:ribosome-associated translation inhibitor RaiA [Catenulispora pinisilvae]